MDKKYELTNETLEWRGRTLHRIRALRDFGNVKAGDLGGWVESERNLSYEGDCWLFDEAKAYDNSQLSGNACASGYTLLFDNSQLSGNARASGDTLLFDNACAYGNARLSGNARASSGARLSDDMYATQEVVYIGGLWWPVTISDNHIRIGCQTHTIDEWAAFSGKEIAEMHADAPMFWKWWGNAILAIAKKRQKEVRYE